LKFVASSCHALVVGKEKEWMGGPKRILRSLNPGQGDDKYGCLKDCIRRINLTAVFPRPPQNTRLQDLPNFDITQEETETDLQALERYKAEELGSASYWAALSDT